MKTAVTILLALLLCWGAGGAAIGVLTAAVGDLRALAAARGGGSEHERVQRLLGSATAAHDAIVAHVPPTATVFMRSPPAAGHAHLALPHLLYPRLLLNLHALPSPALQQRVATQPVYVVDLAAPNAKAPQAGFELVARGDTFTLWRKPSPGR